MEGGWTPALVNLSGALGGAAGTALMGVAFVAATGGISAVGIIAIGIGSYAGSEIGEALSEFLFDPTLEPEFYEETLRNREQRLHEKGIDPNTDPGTQNLRRGLEKARRKAGIPSPSDCPIEDIKEKTRTASNFASPIVLDLDGDGIIRTVGLSSGVNFDHAADGFAERTGWVAPGDGLLVWDRNANGTIDSGRELFGSENVLPNGLKAVNGFEALKAFDVNGDGVIDASDPVYAQLRVWLDANKDGRSGEGELLTLEEAGVKSINVNYTNSSFIDAQGNAHRQAGSYTTTDGQTRAATDVWFTSDVTNSVPTEWVEVPEDIAVLPDAQGYGKVRDLHQAMAMDATGELKALVVAFTQADTVEDRMALVRQIIYRWTGVQDIDPTSRTNSGWGNAIGDARKLEALEEFLGEEWQQYTWGANPGRDAARTLNEAYDQLEALVYGQLMSQSHQRHLFLQVSYFWDEEGERVVGNLSAVAATLSERLQADREAGLTELADFLRSLKGMGLSTRMDIAGFKAALQPLGADVVQTMDTALKGWVPANGPTDGDDVLRGTEFDDVLDGRGGNDRLLGRGGNDTLMGGAGNDVLDGGAGNDQLHGGTGSDTYRFGRGDGHDTIIEDSWITGETDRIELKAGLTPDDVLLTRVRTVNGWQVSDDLKITIRDTGETLTVKNHFNDSNRFAAEEIAFADGSVWNLEDIRSRVLLGEAGNDELRGFNGRDDVMVGGTGNDKLYGLSGDDVLEGGEGNDELYGGDGDDVLIGGKGADLLEGGAGSDTYRYALGDGQDVINEGYTPGEDVLELGAGIAPDDVAVRWTLQGDLAVMLPDGGRITVRGQADTWSIPAGHRTAALCRRHRLEPRRPGHPGAFGHRGR
jgi:Ca2+-binding RTX toxin-like protein